MASSKQVMLYTDGGGERSSSGASACILDDIGNKRRYRLVALLGGATNNECEIFGGLMGLSLCDVLFGRQGLVNPEGVAGTIPVHWVADSEYVLKSATGYIKTWVNNGWKTASKSPVKNQGLWRTYLEISKGCKISPEHVAGHSGHLENEECDNACTWVRHKGQDLAGDRSFKGNEANFLVVQISGEKWWLFDCRDNLEALRDDHPSPASMNMFSSQLRKLISRQQGRQEELLGSREENDENRLSLVLNLLRQAHHEAEVGGRESPLLRNLSSRLDLLIDEYGS